MKTEISHVGTVATRIQSELSRLFQSRQDRTHAEADEYIAASKGVDALVAEVERLRSLLADLLDGPPTYRDYSGTDEDTCAYCKEPLEGFSTDGKHSETCPWAIAKEAV